MATIHDIIGKHHGEFSGEAARVLEEWHSNATQFLADMKGAYMELHGSARFDNSENFDGLSRMGNLAEAIRLMDKVRTELNAGRCIK